jgi:hypothetical protein
MLSKLSIFSRGAPASHADDVVQRTPLTPNVTKALLNQFNFLTAEQIAGWTCERRRSDRPDAREDIKLFDSDGNLVYNGRSFGGRVISFWQP